MNDYTQINHTTYECKYYIVFILKYRKKTLYKDLRNYLEEIFRDFALKKSVR
ncbi:MAG: transposase [Candidatus Cloacimonetes bacterium]|nr:transposase [Candidatus Cloacimonadota bacterium]